MSYGSVFAPGLFAGRVVVVTGGGSGIGRCIAHELAALGAHAVLIGRKPEKLQVVADEISQDGGTASFHVCDIRQEESVKATVAAIVATRGRIDGLVNNAGGQYMTPLEAISAKGWEAVVNTNLTGGFLMARECFLQSMTQTGGSIVNIVADMWGSMPGMGHSGAARAGMVSFTETAAVEWSRKGVRVNAVAPGYIASSGMDHYPPEAGPMLREMAKTVPLGRFGTEAETSAGVVFLLSPAAAFISGTTLRIDGARPQFRMGWMQKMAEGKALERDAIKPFNGFHRATTPKVFSHPMTRTIDETDITPQDIAAVEEAARRFIKTEVAPQLEAWEEAGEFPRALYQRAADLGWLAMGYPERLGGTPAPWALRNAMTVALARTGGSGGLMASLFSHNIGLPPVVRHGSAALQQAVIPDVLSGKKIAALAITEPGGGTDVSALKTTARRDGDDYVVDGEKIFITSGMRADWLTVAVRTDLKNKGPMGISMLMVPGDAAGLSRSPLKKMGWLCSDTAHLRFDGVRVPAGNLVGEEGSGFKMILTNFNGERLSMAAMALGFAECCYDEALSWAQQRKTFGTALVDHQVIRHKLMDMKMRIESTRAWLNAIAARADAGDRGDKSAKGAEWVAQVCLLKNHATQTMQFCADQGVQILGGMGFMRGTACERIYREVKVMMIGGGAEEIMKELASRQLGL